MAESDEVKSDPSEGRPFFEIGEEASNPPASTPVRPKLPNCSGVLKSPYVDLPCGLQTLASNPGWGNSKGAPRAKPPQWPIQTDICSARPACI